MNGPTRRDVRLIVAVALFAVAFGPATIARAQTGGTVYLQTVPALGGISLGVGSARVTTDAGGAAALQVGDLTGIARSVSVAAQTAGTGTLVTLGHVNEQPHAAPHESHLEVGLDVTRTVQIQLDPGDTGVPITAVTSARLRSSTGAVLTFDPRLTSTVELLARRAQLQHGTLAVQTVTWSVDRIAAGQGVALTSAQPRFDPESAANWTLRLATVHGTVRIATVPPTPGVTFVIEGGSVMTGKDGTTTAEVSDLNDIPSKVSLATTNAGNLEVSLRQVTKAPSPGVGVRGVIAGLAVRKPVSLHFTDAAGEVVPASAVTRATVVANGSSVTTSGADLADPVLLLVDRASLVRSAWQARPVRYSLSSVVVDGAAAVFAGQQHFLPSTADTWTIRLAVFRVTVKAHDALFGMRVGSHVIVTRPDGTTYATDVRSGSASTVLPSAVRGNYELDFSAAIFGGNTPVRISRDDSIDVRLITPLDLLVVSLVLAVVAGAAIYAGRRILHRQRGGTP